MPIALDPNQITPVYLDIDADKPETSRPTFLARFLTSRELRQLADLLTNPDRETLDQALDRALAVLLTGWRNIVGRDGKPIPFEVKDGVLVTASDVFTPMEKWETIAKAQEAIRLDEAKKKRLALQPPSGGENSAANASSIENATSPEAAGTSSPSPA